MGLEVVTSGREPEMGAGWRGLGSRRFMDLIEAPSVESRTDAKEGVCSGSLYQVEEALSETGNKSSA